MKNVTLSVLLSATLAIPAMASQNPDSDLADTQKIFRADDAQPMQLAVLSEREMKETEGASHYYIVVIGGKAYKIDLPH